MQTLHHQLALNLNDSISSMLNNCKKFNKSLMDYAQKNKYLSNLMAISLNEETIEIVMPHFGEKITSSSRFFFDENKMPIVYINFHDDSGKNVVHLELDNSGKIHIGQHSIDYDNENLPELVIDIIMKNIFYP